MWRLFAEPDQWHRWSPYVRGARGLGEPEVQAGRRGLVVLGPGLPLAALPVTILAVESGRRWSWRVLGVDMDHAVGPGPAGGCQITITMRAPWPLERALEATYAPVVAVILRRLGRVAAAR